MTLFECFIIFHIDKKTLPSKVENLTFEKKSMLYAPIFNNIKQYIAVKLMMLKCVFSMIYNCKSEL